MKRQLRVLLVAAFCLPLISIQAQPGPGGGNRNPGISGSMAKLFGDNLTFTAVLEMQVAGQSGPAFSMPGKIAYDNGKSHFEADLAEAKGPQMPPQAITQMKAMGMDKMASITLPDKKMAYVIYPSMQAYAEMSLQDADSIKPPSAFKVETTELGKETFGGHPCVKNKAIVTDDKGQKHESTVWNATDLKKFPIKIETSENGHDVTMLFKDVKFGKPSASEFDPPASYKKYDTVQTLMQQEVMKRMGGGTATPGGAGGPPPKQ